MIASSISAIRSSLVSEPGSVDSAGEERSGHCVDVVQDPIDGYGCVPPPALRLGLRQQDQPINAQFLILVDGCPVQRPDRGDGQLEAA
jgi:hypothetical protein